MIAKRQRAFAIGCFTTSRKPEYFDMALACGVSLRNAGHNEPIVLLTVEMTNEERQQVQALGFEVVTKPPLDYPALQLSEYPWLWYNDAQKMHFWDLPFQKVIALDPDILCIRNCKQLWSWPELSCVNGRPYSPISSGMMVLEPRQEKYERMTNILFNGSFDLDTGWQGVGRFPHWSGQGQLSDWSFQCANGSQGFLFYFFKWQQASLHLVPAFHKFFSHFAGPKKKHPDYQRQVRELLLNYHRDPPQPM